MTVYGWGTILTQLVGLGLVLAGLYRRDPAAQGRWAAVRGRFGRWWRRLLHLPPRVVYAGGDVTLTRSGGARARGVVQPGERDPSADVSRRLAWLERAADLIHNELTSEEEHRARDLSALRSTIEALRGDAEANVSELRRRFDEARIPERLEWWGAGLVVLSLMFGVLDTAL
jgi:hypothetical protein